LKRLVELESRLLMPGLNDRYMSVLLVSSLMKKGCFAFGILKARMAGRLLSTVQRHASITLPIHVPLSSGYHTESLESGVMSKKEYEPPTKGADGLGENERSGEALQRLARTRCMGEDGYRSSEGGGLRQLPDLFLSEAGLFLRLRRPRSGLERSTAGKSSAQRLMKARIIAKVSQETLAEMIGTTRSRVSFFMRKQSLQCLERAISWARDA
jgi:hypothetical protein